MKKQRHVHKHNPQRTCVGCRKVLSKKELLRIVRTPDGIIVDPSGKLNGRGAYLHTKQDCWERALKGSLANALKVDFTKQDLEYLREYQKSLPENNLKTH